MCRSIPPPAGEPAGWPRSVTAAEKKPTVRWGRGRGSLALTDQAPNVVHRKSAVKSTGATVAVIEDDESVRKALRRLIRSVGLTVTTHASAEEFLAAAGEPVPGCLILDVRLPGMSGLDLQRFLADSGRDIAIV